MSTCEACRAPVDTKRSVKCTKCARTFHLVCVNLMTAEITTEFRAAWICPNCRCIERKGDNTNTPVRSSSAKLQDNNKHRYKKDNASAHSLATEGPSTESSLILAEIKMLRQDMTDLKLQLKEIKDNHDQRMNEFDCTIQEFKSQLAATTSGYNRRIDEFDLSLQVAVQRITALEDTKSDVRQLESRLVKLEDVIMQQVQPFLRNEMEIVGIPELPNENLYHIILLAADKIGVALQDCDIDYVERVGPKTNNSQRPRLVVVRFVRSYKRDVFLKAARARRNVNSGDFVGQSNNTIYFNERLSKSNRQLFREARLRAKNNGFQFCWTRNGLVLIRKEQGRPAITIRNKDDLDRHLKNPERELPTDVPTAGSV